MNEIAAIEFKTDNRSDVQAENMDAARMEDIDVWVSQLEEICQEEIDIIFHTEKERKIAKERLELELSVINYHGAGYMFLYVRDLLKGCSLNPLQYMLQGTGAGYLISYLLGIIHVDPRAPEVRNLNNIFERFNKNLIPKFILKVDKGAYETVKKYAEQVNAGGKFMQLFIEEDEQCTRNAGFAEMCHYYATAEDVKSTDKKLGVFSRFTFEGIYEYLCRCGFDEWNAYVFACGVRRGTLSRNGISEEQKKLINTHNIPREFCNACLQADHIPLYAEEQEALYTDVTGVFFMLTYPDVILNAD